MKSSLRTVLVALVGAGAVTGCTALLGSFDVGEGAGPDGTDGQTSADGPVSSDGSPIDASTDNAVPVVCKDPEVACNNVCTRLATSSDHCGKCGHSCGGGRCDTGVCKPFKLYDGALAVGPVAIGDTDMFFATDDGNVTNQLFACPKTGCKTLPKQLALMQYSIRGIAVPQKGTVVFLSAPTQTTERPAIYACPALGCPSPPTSFAADGLNGIDSRLRVFNDRVFYVPGGSGLSWSTCAAGGGPCSPANHLGSLTRGTHGFSVDATNMYFVDSPTRASTIAKCAQADTACTPVTVVPGDNSTVQTTAVFGGKLFWLQPGRDDFNEGKLISCDLPACTTPKPSAVGLDSPTELIVDASGAYWLTKGGPTAATPKIQRCLPNGCVGGAQDFASGPLAVPHSITADDAFVYWAEKSAIWLLAK